MKTFSGEFFLNWLELVSYNKSGKTLIKSAQENLHSIYCRLSKYINIQTSRVSNIHGLKLEYLDSLLMS
jgi:hypothetical protein